jgi:hypothetical protein
MSKKVYGLSVDNGDGSSSIHWYQNTSLQELLEKIDSDPESYWGNEGSPTQTLKFPDDLDLKACGFYFQD